MTCHMNHIFIFLQDLYKVIAIVFVHRICQILVIPQVLSVKWKKGSDNRERDIKILAGICKGEQVIPKRSTATMDAIGIHRMMGCNNNFFPSISLKDVFNKNHDFVYCLSLTAFIYSWFTPWMQEPLTIQQN